MQVCKHCSLQGAGNYCSNCGEVFAHEKISIHSIVHEAIHTFTHADKGLLYTLKNLALHPGIMQRNYLEGERKTNQKPFPLFFICASITAIALHFVNITPPESQSHFDIVKEYFYKNYYVILQTVLLPFYALVTWLTFYSKYFNYAEVLVLLLYTLSFSLLIIIPVNFLGYAFEDINEQFVELIFLSVYMILTNINFFRAEKKWIAVMKSIIVLLACYFTSNFMGRQVINFML